MPPWKYLGLQIAAKTIVPQKLEIECNPKTLADLHSLCGSLNWEGRNSPKRWTKEMFEHLLQSNASLQLSLDSYRGQISVHAPSHKLLNEEFHLIPREKRSRRPLKALTVFPDASGASHKSVMTWRNPQTQRWEADVEFVEGSPQVAELAAVVRAFEKFSEPINLVTDSAYVAGVVSRAEQAVLKEIDNEHLFRLLSKLIYLISHREHPFYVMHVRSHTDLPGEIAEGNRQADSLAAPVEKARLPDIFQQAKLSHQQYHQNVPGLIRQFQLTRSQARAIVATCPNCQVQAMPSMEKAYLTLNPVMNPIQVVILLLLNSLATAWIIPQPCQNVWVTLAQTLPQENICLSTASTENPMSTCLVGIPLQAGEFTAGLDTHRSKEIPEPNTFRPYKGHQQKSGMTVNPLEEWLPSLPKEEEVNNLFYKQLENVSGSSALVLVGDFNLPDICWELDTAEKRQSRKFLECKEDNFLLLLDNKKCFYKYINGKRKVFSGKTTCLQDNCPLGLVDGASEQNSPPIIQEEAVRELLRCLDTHKSMGPDGIHPRVMRELADELAKPLCIIYHQSWLTGEVPDDWKLANVTPIHKKGGREDPGSYRPVSQTSVPGKIMEQFILSLITQNLQDGQGLRPSQHGFRRGRSCLTNLITFYDQVTSLVDAGKAVDVVY
ncbi:hypothetical protein DUI87_02387 [Hirundo rustica rustica]|uniref:Uncharacterized protein n=1 Tax=Hirundo rustica rustica TaxID=333673 RepID=A0A3M0L8T2_HIRRU|nr:hypothetical protein DUI87_02387 [Hirundo rustica rustica]